MVATITSKGQLTIPKTVRKRLKLQAGDRLEFVFDNSENCRIVPLKSSIKRLKAIVPKPGRKVTLEEMQKAIEAEGRI
jgi:antitoxin PrlF